MKRSRMFSLTAVLALLLSLFGGTLSMTAAQYEEDRTETGKGEGLVVNTSAANRAAADQDSLEDLLAYPGGKKWALTFSYDDGSPYDPELVNIFNKYGMKGTFNLIANCKCKLDTRTVEI